MRKFSADRLNLPLGKNFTGCHIEGKVTRYFVNGYLHKLDGPAVISTEITPTFLFYKWKIYRQ